MSHPHDIDNEEAIFQFDPYEGPSTLRHPSPHQTLLESSRDMSSDDETHTSEEISRLEQILNDVIEKGKGKTLPMLIPIRADMVHDTLDMSPTSDNISRYSPFSSPLTPSSFSFRYFEHLDGRTSPNNARFSDLASGDSELVPATNGDISAKGKARETPPTLPPLSFSPTDSDYLAYPWQFASFESQSAGPSSLGSSQRLQSRLTDSPSNLTEHMPSTESSSLPDVLKPVPSRHRSLASIPIAKSMSNLKSKLHRGSSNLTKRLLSDKLPPPPPPTPCNEFELPTTRLVQPEDARQACIEPWQPDFTTIEAGPLISQYPHFYSTDTFASSPTSSCIRPHSYGNIRSNTSPLPFSALDYVFDPPPVIFIPPPIIIRNYFDEILPKELRLQIFEALIASHEHDRAKDLRDGVWSVAKASSSKGKWVGKDKAFRELVKFSRVSKRWQALAFDGQLWTHLRLRSFAAMPTSIIAQLTKCGGTFTQVLDVAGHYHILPTTIMNLTDKLRGVGLGAGPEFYTQLTSIHLQGCHSISTEALHHLLASSPFLETLGVKGLIAVTNDTCDILGAHCPRITDLNLNRCVNVDGGGVRRLLRGSVSRRTHLPLKVLRLSGMRYVDDALMMDLARAAPNLEVLDLSYARQLHNSSLDVFVACDNLNDDDTTLGFPTISLSAREAGRVVSDGGRYRRRVTKLRHLSLSNCLLLTDIACSNLAHCVPRLEFLEMAGIGAELRDEGLVRLLETTPLIKRLDLEDAAEITDAVLVAITPSSRVANVPLSNGRGPPPIVAEELEPGRALEHLVISYAINVTNDALLNLIRGCTKLQTLEADNTGMGSSVMREFIALSRERKIANARVVAVDCRGVTEALIKEVSGMTRPRLGWRSHEARKLKYLDGRDGCVEDLKIGQDECDEMRVVVKTFYSWQTVDAVKAGREKRRRANTRRAMSESMDSTLDLNMITEPATRWWTPGGRRPRRNSPPAIANVNDDGCRLM